ncbi:MAG TPA: hypothetical protein ENI51_00965, partial [Candidatus Atribacteria bacterium]|nr:hypothetical protein [Candidatus Atribacteria bacterium]
MQKPKIEKTVRVKRTPAKGLKARPSPLVVFLVGIAKTVKKIEKEHLFILLAGIVLFLVKGVFGFLSAENLAGHDLIGNYTFAWLMNQFMKNLSFFGWSKLWFAGFPAFIFYSPLFFIVVNLLHFLSFGAISIMFSYKIVILASLLVLPNIVFFSAKKMGFEKQERLFITLLSFAFLFLFGKNNMVSQTLNFGLVAQMFAMNFFILFLGYMFTKEYKKTGLFLGLTILSHIFAGAVAVVCLLMYTLLDREYYKNMKVFLIGLLLASPWLFLVLKYIGFVNTYFNPGKSLLEIPIIFFIFMSFSLVKFKEKRVKYLWVLFAFLAIISTLSISTLGIYNIKIQYDRLFPYMLFLVCVLSGQGLLIFSDLLHNNFNLKLDR